MSSQAPSEGQKVDLGKNAPTKQEGTGNVPSESLAAQSAKEGGQFASNEGLRGENQASSRSENTSAGRTTNTSSAPSSGSGNSSAGTAPSYADAQYIKASGPHGKNLKEGIDDSKTEDGLQKALNAEPGSQDDPSRVAELQFQQNQTAAGRDAGPKQGEVTNKTAFDALNNETSS
ncbi:hypothetical protein NW762_006683 [Fusarium torreyae]|uniref:Uncharacterized protein n=1 Tax=Fusarium torreyae TaxID=1237075 RepID=A0A9W8RZG7_9HYPO|nr:hypothetical protein NW762_006683 [Fusarium torreyae]